MEKFLKKRPAVPTAAPLAPKACAPLAPPAPVAVAPTPAASAPVPAPAALSAPAPVVAAAVSAPPPAAAAPLPTPAAVSAPPPAPPAAVAPAPPPAPPAAVASVPAPTAVSAPAFAAPEVAPPPAPAAMSAPAAPTPVSAPAVEIAAAPAPAAKKKAPKRKRPKRDPTEPLRRSKRDPNATQEKEKSTCQGQDTGEALARAFEEAALLAGDAAPLVEKLAEKARKKHYDRPEAQRISAAKVAAIRAAKRGGKVDRNERATIGATVSQVDWDRASQDLEAVLPLSEDFCWRKGQAHFEAGHEAMKAYAIKALEGALHQPVARTAHRPVIINDPLRSYATLTNYIPFPGADEREAATARRLLKVTNVEPGLVAAAYAVDDDAIGEKWRLERAAQQDSSHARVVINGVSDRLCAAVVARSCADENATYTPLELGKDVKELPGLGLDCYCRRTVQLACAWCGVDEALAKDAARTKLAPYLRQLSETEKTPSFLVHATRRLWSLNQDEVSGAVCAAAAFLGSDAWFKARPKGTAVVAKTFLKAQKYVCDYLGDVYPPYRWLEKLASTQAVRRLALGQQYADAVPSPELFHNIALERPQQDPLGYSLLWVDAGGRNATFASSLSHDCDGNVATSVRVDTEGNLGVALHTTRPIKEGEEMTFDYGACTSSEREWRESICLCGAPTCRGSFVELVAADELQQCLKRAHNPLDAVALLLRACLPSQSNEYLGTLQQHGFRQAFFDCVDDCQVPVWLERYVAELISFLEFERGQLPYALLRYYGRDKEGENGSAAAIRARLVLEQRVQSLACAVSVARRVQRLTRETGAPFRMASSDESAAVLRRSLLKLAVFAQRTPDLKLNAALAGAHVPEHATRRTCRDALLACRTALLVYAADAPPPIEVKKTKRGQKEAEDPTLLLRQSALCAADALLLAAHTHTFVKVSRRGTVTAPGVDVVRDDVASFPCKQCDHKAPLYNDAVRCQPQDVLRVQERTYGPLAEVEALLRWHDTDALADPDLGMGLLSVKDLRGCALLPDASAILEASLGGYDATLQKQLADALEDPVSRNRPWPEAVAKCFFPAPVLDEWWGAPALDAALESCAAAVLDVVKTLRGGVVNEVSDSNISSPVGNEDPTDAAMADALPDKPPSRWVACDLCEKWRRVPWHATIEIDDSTSFKCMDQQQWGVVEDEAGCDIPESSFIEDDVVISCSELDDAVLVEGAKVDARCGQTGCWFAARVTSVERVEGKASNVGLHFEGWHKKFDEVYELPRDQEKLAPHRTFSAANATAKRIARGGAAQPKKRKRSSGKKR